MIAKPSPSLPITATAPGSDMLTESQWTITAQSLKLTKREQQVCQKLFDGNTRNEIAEKLGIKSRTVRHYMEHIHEKLCVSNRVGVVLRIIQMRDQIEKNRFASRIGEFNHINQ